MREAPPRSGMASPSPLDGYKAPYPPHLRLATSLLSIVPVTSQTAPLLTALLAGPGFGRPTRQLRCHFQAPSITSLSPPDPTHARSLVLSFDHPSRRRPANDAGHDGVPETFRSAPRLPTRRD